MAEPWLYGIVLLALIGLNVLQFWFFAKELQVLVDKLMSRDFGDYQRTLRAKQKNTSPRIEIEPYEEKPPEGFVI